ncbi:MAG: M15 family metallopeptidase, partial [Sphingomonas sp.]
MIRAMVLLRGVAAVVLICAASAPTLARNADLPSATTPDGRLYGHIAYAEADPAVLVDAPKGFAVGQECKVQPAMIPDLTRLIAAAHEAHLGADLRGVSCFRTVEHQERLFCEKHGRSGECVDPDKRAISVAPPGHSEHATGYAIDFATRPEGGCADVENCFADTPVGRWLLLNAADYGFELSFPK